MRDITMLHPELQKKLDATIRDCRASGITIKIGECLRTVEEQNALYAQGRTKPGNIVTNAPGSSHSSQHQWGIAADFFLVMDIDGDGKTSDDAFNDSTGVFGRVGAIAKAHGLGWGGDWTSPVDKPHLYLPQWGSTTRKLKSMYGTPDKFIATWQKTGGAASGTGSASAGGDSKIKLIQNWCNIYCKAGITSDGYYGPKTRAGLLKALQTYLNVSRGANLVVDGIWGRKTKAACVTASGRSDQVLILQYILYCRKYNPGSLDGIMGKNTIAAIKEFQKYNGLTVDGYAGKDTFEKLFTT